MFCLVLFTVQSSLLFFAKQFNIIQTFVVTHKKFNLCLITKFYFQYVIPVKKA